MRKAILAIGLIFSASASANYYCEGNIAYLGVSDSGVLAVSNGNGVHYLCNLSDEYCKSWFTLATSAKMANRELQIYYKNSTISGPNAEACAVIGDWVTPTDNAYHIVIK